MGLSLQEQLLKAGMVNKKQVKQAEHEKRVKNKKKRKYGAPAEDSAKIKLQQQQAELAKQQQKLSAEQNQQRQRKADQAAAKQLIKSNQLALDEGDVVYRYVASGKIKQISVTQDVADKLSAGRAGLAMGDKDVVLIPTEAVLKILKRDEDSILLYNDPAQVEDDYPSDW
ncbi:hypothetical protein SAMN05660420_00820 [Desulfuromusa kysingii]|uniref:Nucleoprotein/polynucleotide-associated enzyme n=1 Tax=Desulfuromusa kysingii TaxID=37625 RepID=A0A1H3X4Y1_9BACT|nr:DUF2058 family protein [Desulfuromusa kysingii]SDZ94283.1 hypothetical protein SAMN05660420_00820 [Desulfuromusa kysingii]